MHASRPAAGLVAARAAWLLRGVREHVHACSAVLMPAMCAGSAVAATGGVVAMGSAGAADSAGAAACAETQDEITPTQFAKCWNTSTR